MSKVTLENTEETLSSTHSESVCKGEPCTIHNRSDHHMRSFPQHWRADRGIMERMCPHGIGHPDPDDPKTSNPAEAVHGCDGCCFTSPTRHEMGQNIVRLLHKVNNLSDILEAIEELHQEKYKDITGTSICQECDQYLPCDTLKIIKKKKEEANK